MANSSSESFSIIFCPETLLMLSNKYSKLYRYNYKLIHVEIVQKVAILVCTLFISHIVMTFVIINIAFYHISHLFINYSRKSPLNSRFWECLSFCILQWVLISLFTYNSLNIYINGL